ncbi:MAG: ankyrin repeat domain-containing protein [bacterium]|nr:ankyrin repeat domain-containing protein [bacterium]
MERISPFAAKALGIMGPKAVPAVTALTAKLSESKGASKNEYINALGSIGPAAAPAVPVIVSLIGSYYNSDDAVKALGKIGFSAREASLPPMLKLLKKSDIPISARVDIAVSMVKMGALEEALPALTDMLRDKNPVSGCKAQECIVKGGATFVSAIIAAISDSDRLVCSRAISIAGEMGDIAGGAVSVLLKILHGNDTMLRCKAARALGKIGPASSVAVPELAAMLESGDWFCRAVATEALGNIGPAAIPSVDMLINRLNDNKAYKRAEAALDLGRMGPVAVKSVSVLIGCVSDTDIRVRIRAIEALRKIMPESDEVIRTLVALLDDEDEWVRYHVVETIRRIGYPARRAVSRLNELLKEAQHKDNSLAVFMKKRITKALQMTGSYDDALCYHVDKNPLIKAACDGDIQRMLSLIDQGTDVNVRDTKSWTPLFYAIDRHQFKAATVLIDRGADVNARSAKGYTPLLYASVQQAAGISGGVFEAGINDVIIRLLGKKADPNVVAPADGGYTLSEEPMSNYLIENNAIRKGDTALTATVRRQHTYLAELLLAKGADPNVGRVQGRDALLWAIGNRQKKIALMLIDKGANLNTRDEYYDSFLGRTPLTFAAAIDPALVAALIEKGVDIKATDADVKAALKHAIHYNADKTFEILLKHGALQGMDTGHILIEVTRRNVLEMAKAVLDTGQSVNIHDDNRVTPLILAVKHSNPEMVKLFLERGADVKAMDKSGQTALSIAIEKGNREIVNLLKKAGATH